jgi:hypothetical protein
MTGRTRSEQAARRKRDAELDADLDQALAQTFPASDPFSVGHFTGTEPPTRSIDHKAPRLETAPQSRRKRKSAR